MNEQLYLTPETHQNLMAHLVNFEEQMDKIIDEYYPQLNQERREISELIRKYSNRLAELVKMAITSAKTDYSFPCVIIGSEVTIRDLASQEIFYYSISGPYHNGFTGDAISYLSPVGRALLLKKAGEIVAVETPSGQYSYEILSITYGKPK
jgi:transcription elongation factor GreA